MAATDTAIVATLVGAGAMVGAGAFGWLVKIARDALIERMDMLDQSVTRSVATLLGDLHGVDVRLEDHERRITRVESKYDILTLPDAFGRRRRTGDDEDDSG